MNNDFQKPLNPQPGTDFQTDSQKIVQRHLQDENDVITEEDIRGVRIGMTPSQEEDSQKKMEELIDEVEAENKDKGEDEISANDDPITPWDTLQR